MRPTRLERGTYDGHLASGAPGVGEEATQAEPGVESSDCFAEVFGASLTGGLYIDESKLTDGGKGGVRVHCRASLRVGVPSCTGLTRYIGMRPTEVACMTGT